MTAIVRYWAIIPAAGTGSRFGGEIPKQYLSLGARCVMQHSVDRLCDSVPLSRCVIALSKSDRRAPQLSFKNSDQLCFVIGGAERMDSVLVGLESLVPEAAPTDWVLVHDVARPCIHAESLKKLLTALAADPVGGVLAVPVRDTLKLATAGVIDRTVPRENLWQCQTPQMFRFGLLLAALRQAKADSALVTDEASALERMGHVIRVVEGRSDNIKITYPEDLALAQAILQAQSAQG